MDNLSECTNQYPDIAKKCAMQTVQQDRWAGLVNNNNFNERTQRKLASEVASEGIAHNLKRTATSEDLSSVAGTVEDEGGGVAAIANIAGVQEKQFNGLTALSASNSHDYTALGASESHEVASAAVAIVDANDLNAYVVGAASLTPPAGGSAQSHSNRTSINNSTENLSYSSDNYYADDLILLGDDDDLDVEAEEISLNSDDCVYAYRGDGADFDFALHQIAGGRAGDIDLADDETDFLEMDFEPDPLSEAEFGPIDDMPPQNVLQTQALLSKNFARISLHLDQIKGVEENDHTNDSSGGGVANLEFQRVPTLSGLSDVAADVAAATTAQSLPNTLHHGNFGRDTLDNVESKTSPTKITGAKPKRLSTSSSTSSKNSNKSRTSLRSVYSTATPLCNTSFDERSASCAEFRSAVTGTLPPQQIKDESCVNSSLPRVIADLGTNNDETACLDCLEKEFLANTIGKALDLNNCYKCRRHSRSLSLYARAAQQTRSSSFFNELDIFDVSHDFSNTREDWTSSLRSKMPAGNVDGELTAVSATSCVKKVCKEYDVALDTPRCSTRSPAEWENFITGEQLLKNLLSTDEHSITISMANLNAESLEQALEKLHVFYNAEILQTHFEAIHNKAAKRYRDLTHFLLHESKKRCNQPKLKRLIKLATRDQVEVEFEKDADITELELVPVNVADILPYCIPIKNLESLQQLNDKRFIEANVLGKIANIMRLAQQQRRPLPDFILIPQYYETGFITLIKKC